MTSGFPFVVDVDYAYIFELLGTVQLLAGQRWSRTTVDHISKDFHCSSIPECSHEVPCSSLFRKQENPSAYFADV